MLSLGYRPDAFMAAYPDAECAGVRLRYAVEDTPLDTAGAIRFAATEAPRSIVINRMNVFLLVCFRGLSRSARPDLNARTGRASNRP